MSLEDKAKGFYSRSRMCSTCKYNEECMPHVSEVCNNAFVKGFIAGWREHAFKSKKRARNESFNDNEGSE